MKKKSKDEKAKSEKLSILLAPSMGLARTREAEQTAGKVQMSAKNQIFPP